jgi:hypothetical protein
VPESVFPTLSVNFLPNVDSSCKKPLVICNSIFFIFHFLRNMSLTILFFKFSSYVLRSAVFLINNQIDLSIQQFFSGTR